MNFDVPIYFGHRLYLFFEFIEAFCKNTITITSYFRCLQLLRTIFHRDSAGKQKLFYSRNEKLKIALF